MKFVPKGWGWERHIANSDLYCGKLLYVAQDRRCSVHFHKLKDETFYVNSGKLQVKYILYEYYEWKELYDPDKPLEEYVHYWNHCTKWDKILEPGDSLHLPPLTIHQFEGVRDTELFEFSTQHFDDDSYRIIPGD